MFTRCAAALNGDIVSALPRALNFVYTSAAAMGGVCLIAVVCLVIVQALARWVGLPIGGLTETATYTMAASLFLPLGYTFRVGAHIRVSILLERLSDNCRCILELWCLGVGSVLSVFLAWSAISMVGTSFIIGDISPGADATPLWIPQLAMAWGTITLAIAVLEELVVRTLARWSSGSCKDFSLLSQAQQK